MRLNSFFLLLFLSFYSSLYVCAQKHYQLNDDKSKLSLNVDSRNTRLAVNDILRGKRGTPLPEAKLYNIDVAMDTLGKWNSSQDGSNVWIMEIDVPQAKGFFVSFNDFYLPQGSLLYVYNREEYDDAIVYKHDDNPRGGAYSLENLKGDNVILEYVAPPSVKEKPSLTFFNVGYKYATGIDNNLEFNLASNSCMPNISCVEADNWQNQKKGVLRIRVNTNGGSFLCSGALINNTRNDKTPYVLTSEHCFPNVSKEDIINTEFYFEYESPICEPNTRPTYKYHRGAEMLILNPLQGGSDGALLRLSEPIPDNWDVYYNGWDLTNDGNSVTGGAVIHHPLGDVKKISLYNRALVSGRWSENSNTSADTHWIVSYSSGATAGGSSGSPIFTQNGLITGTLSGGSSSCASQKGTDYFGKLWYHWNQSSNTAEHMKTYLDPDNTGARSLSGLPAIEGPNPDPNPGQHPELYYYIEDNNLRLYAKDIINKIRVVNLAGYAVFSKEDGFTSSVYDIPVSTWRGGVYVLSVGMEGRSTKSIKIFK